MNERIRKLAEQSGFRSSVTVTDGNDKVIVTTIGKDLEKFAELIVRECADVARQADIDGCNIGNYAWEKIKEHFGVKE